MEIYYISTLPEIHIDQADPNCITNQLYGAVKFELATGYHSCRAKGNR